MRRAFGDSFLFIALLNPRDSFHQTAVEVSRHWEGQIVDALAARHSRRLAPPLDWRRRPACPHGISAFQLFSVSTFARAISAFDLVVSAFDVVLSVVRICMTVGVEPMLQ
jgi:hypothetical protein